MASFIFDLHAHFSFKAANSENFFTGQEPDPDHWKERFRKELSGLAKVADKTVIKSSQLNGDACTEGGHRIICNGLYPLERGFISGTVVGVIATLTGYSKKSLKDLKDHQVSYYDVLKREYMNILEHQDDGTRAKYGNKYFLVNSFQEIIGNLKNDQSSINIINTIEGAHAFASDIRDANGKVIPLMTVERAHIRSLAHGGNGDPDFKRHITALLLNVERVRREWKYSPFFVGISHHYYNHLSGHSESLTHIVDLLLNQDGGTINRTGQPHNFYYLGLQDWCLPVIHKLLSRNLADGTPARRCLIDVKHMSPQARLDYYALLDANRQHHPNDRIPIVKSHTAVSGRRELQRSIDRDFKLTNDEKERGKYFYDGFINLFDDEIIRIIDSDGIIGMMIDERRIMSRDYILPPEAGISRKKFKDTSKKSSKALNDIVNHTHEIMWRLEKLKGNPANVSRIQQEIQDFQNKLKGCEVTKKTTADILRPAYLSVVLRQIFHILDLTGEHGWDHLCLGTDYDGVINPIDIYPQSKEMVTMEDDFIKFWTAMTIHQDTQIRAIYNRHLYGKSIDWWVRKFIVLNGMNFLKKYFNDAYLKDGIIPNRGWALTQTEMNSLSFPTT